MRGPIPALANSSELTLLESTVRNLENQIHDEKQLRSLDQQRFAKIEARLEESNNRLLNSIVNSALLEGKILPYERENWLKALDSDFEKKSFELANTVPVLQTKFTRVFTNNSAGTPAEMDNKTRNRFTQDWIKERMKQKACTYNEAWAQLKEEIPDLYPEWKKHAELDEQYRREWRS